MLLRDPQREKVSSVPRHGHRQRQRELDGARKRRTQGESGLRGFPLRAGTHEVASSPPPGPVDGRWLTLSALGGEVARMVGGVAVDGRPWGIGLGGASSHLHRDSVGGA